MMSDALLLTMLGTPAGSPAVETVELSSLSPKPTLLISVALHSSLS